MAKQQPDGTWDTDTGNHPGGRPTKYTPELICKVEEYIEGCKDENNPIDIVPGLVGFSLWSNIPLNTLNHWKQREIEETDWPRFAEFRNILDRLHRFQCQQMLNKGGNGTIREGIAKLVLGKHGYHSSVDVTSGGKAIKPTISIGVDSD